MTSLYLWTSCQPKKCSLFVKLLAAAIRSVVTIPKSSLLGDLSGVSHNINYTQSPECNHIVVYKNRSTRSSIKILSVARYICLYYNKNIDLHRAQIMSTLCFITLDVFTSTQFLGNPLAIVHVPNDLKNVLSQTQKQTIAREFNLSETVFMHEGSPDRPITIDIFTTDAELPFAGHPSIGSGRYLLSRYPAKDRVTLRTKAGDIPVVRSGNGKVRLQIPIDFKAHPRCVHPRVKVLQPQLNDSDYTNGLEGPEAVASIVKGMTFLLLQLTSENALARLLPPPERLSMSGLGEWDGFVGLYFFYKREDGVLRTRMFDGPLEDPATGSAAATLASWLAKERGQGVWTFHVVQGVEMGRRGEVEVMVGVDAGSEVERVELGGSAVEIMEGTIRTGHEA